MSRYIGFETRRRPSADVSVDVPSDLSNAFRLGDATDPWAALTGRKNRAHLSQIGTAKSAEALLTELST